MLTTAPHNTHDNTPEAVLFMAFKLREKIGKRGFTSGHGHKPHERIIAARDGYRKIKRPFPLPAASTLASTPRHRDAPSAPAVAPGPGSAGRLAWDSRRWGY